MKNNNEFDKFLINKMSVDNMEFETPSLSAMEEARQKILLRKKPAKKEEKNFRFWLTGIIQSKLKFYQLGVSVLLTCICLIYCLEFNEIPKKNNGLENYTTGVVASKSATVSVNSSTLLTSIPTLIIRN